VEIDWKHYVLPAVAAVVYLGWLVLRPADVGEQPPVATGEPSTADAAAGGSDESPPTTPQKRSDRDAMRERIDEALRQHEKTGEGKPVVPAGSKAPVPHLDPVWVRERIVEDVAPAAQRCYLDRLDEDPSLQARIDVVLTFVGHESVGTVVDEAEVVAASLDDADLVECMRESILALVMEPPRGGGKRTVQHSLVFAPPDGGG
jgi:hypothetical protein